MGFLEKFFKKSDSNKRGEQKSPDSSDMNFKHVSINFTEFYNLIHLNREININQDVIMDVLELNRFSQGIPIDIDGTVIDGNNKSISSNNKSRIFNVTAKNVIIRNFNFKNGFNPEFGGAIYIQKGASCIIENCIFENHRSYAGGAILNLGDLLIRDSKFNSNISEYSGGAITNMAKLKINGSKFSFNQSTGGGAIYNHYDSFLEVDNTELSFNNANQGGSILSLSKTDIGQTVFRGNSAKYGGGAINSSDKSDLSIKKCDFIDNKAMDGGAIVNMSKTNIYCAKFENNYSQIGGGSINNVENAIMDIESCNFTGNKSDTYGGAVFNMGNLNLKDAKFVDNFSSGDGGALNFQKTAKSKVSNIQCISNRAKNGGGLLNFGNTNIENGTFEKNDAHTGSAIFNESSTLLNISKTDFIGNSSNVVFNNSEIKFLNCGFLQNVSDSFIISNNKILTCIDTTFENNSSKIVINNMEDARSEFMGGEFISNVSTISAICNAGERCIVNKTMFWKNSSNENNCGDIYNKTTLYVYEPKFEDSSVSILNEGYINASKAPCDDLMDHIENQGKVDCISNITPSKSTFLDLDNLIHNNGNGKIILEKDIKLEINEIDFYDGGIDLDRDNLVIDGQGNSIDGNFKSRIFNVFGKNITLKNITFKNAHLFNEYEENSSGGGAIKISKGASLTIENCKFESNDSQGNGGAILNNGELQLTDSTFEDNCSKTYGGAIYSRDVLKLNNCVFKNNKSEIAGAIFNKNYLYMDNYQFSNNPSNIDQQIYNVGLIETEDYVGDLVYNVGEFNKRLAGEESFTYLNKQILENNELKLNCDIKFDYKTDREYENGIEIEKDIVIDGMGHIIDGSDFSSVFNITQDNVHVVLKNLIFKNAYSTTKSVIENDASLILENCMFINNKSCDETSLINNHNCLVISDSIFSCNSSNKNSLINNIKEIEISNSNFIINSSKSDSPVLSNNIPEINEDLKGTAKVMIRESDFNSNLSFGEGGAINNGSWSILKIENSRFINNRSHANGGAIVNNGGELNLTHCYFENNNARYGGSIYSNRFANLKIYSTRFYSNSSKGGGAIVNMGELLLKDSLFENNSSNRSGGALFTQHAGTLMIFNTQFAENTTDESGGAIFIQDGKDKFIEDSSIEGITVANYTRVNINDSKFINNSSKSDGGAINNQKNSIVEISGCGFIGNESDNFGGAISNFGNLTLRSTKFSENKAKDAGAVITSSEVINEQCEFSDNYPNNIKRGL